MKKKLIEFINNVLVRAICFSLLSFFVFIALNVFFNYLVYAVVIHKFNGGVFFLWKILYL